MIEIVVVAMNEWKAVTVTLSKRWSGIFFVLLKKIIANQVGMFDDVFMFTMLFFQLKLILFIFEAKEEVDKPIWNVNLSN